MPDSASTVEQLLARLARLEDALAERDALIEELRASNEALTRRVAQLEAALRKDSRNSSKPPSSDGPRKPPPRSQRRASGRSPGKQPGDPGVTLRQVDDPDEVVVHEPVSCRGCHGSLADAPESSVEIRQVFDLPETWMWITEHRVQHRRRDCGASTMAEVPAGVGAPTSTGREYRRWPRT